MSSKHSGEPLVKKPGEQDQPLVALLRTRHLCSGYVTKAGVVLCLLARPWESCASSQNRYLSAYAPTALICILS